MFEKLTTNQKELLVYAARLVTEEGLDYGHAKKMALRDLKLPANTRIPDNDAMEHAIREYIELFHAENQPLELKRLRELALQWMQTMQEFSPFVSGAVWHGLATKQSDIYLQLFCEDPKMAEIFLINHHIQYTTSTVTKKNNQIAIVLTAQHFIPEWEQYTLIHLVLNDQDDIRGALKLDAQKRAPQGSITALQKLLSTTKQT